ncbi:MAG: polysaccharide deacetylase family protein [Flavobacteriales bacterium]|nr:polysaccharide deacetylase family protein [Flavobacteriales bacterium]
MRWIFLVLLAAPCMALAQNKRVCITIDDLPCANCAEGTWQQVTTDLLRTLTEHQVPAIGFVNENKLFVHDHLDSNRYRLLEQWLDAGMELGNHTYSHPGATATDLRTYTADIVRGEAHLRPLIAGRQGTLRYFRHPFLQAGATVGRRDTLNGVLDSLGYTIAPVTFDNDEYIHAFCYEHARRRGQDSLMSAIAEEYLNYMARVVHFHEEQAQALMGREIPHILLLHANALNASELDRLLRWFVQEGYTFISLDEALNDPVYTLPEATTRYGFSWIRRWQLAQGQEPPWPPEVDPVTLATYNALRTP